MAELQARITYSEFLEWIVFLKREHLRQLKQEFALAQIAAEVRRGWVSNPKAVKVDDFLITLRESGDQCQASKETWARCLNVKLN